MSSWGGAADNGTEQPRWAIKDDFSYIRGSHSFKFGVTYDHQEANGFGQQNIAGQAGFSFLETAVPGRRLRRPAAARLPRSCSATADTGRHRNGPLPASRSTATGASTRRTTGASAASSFSTTACATNSRCRRCPAATSTPTSRRPTPNPAVNNYPGALIFAGTGPGRQGKRSLIPGYYGSISPRLGLAYSPDAKTTIRAGIGRSFGRVTVLASSSHYAGFIGQYTFASTNQGITPAFNWDQGLPSYPLPPQINPAFANNGNVDYWNGQNSTRPAEYDNWTVSVQREVRPHLTVEVGLQRRSGLAPAMPA